MSPAERVDRRTVLKSATAGFAATMLAPGLMLLTFGRDAKGAGPGATGNRRWGMLIDVSRCQEGCSACVDACSREHGWHVDPRGATEPQWIRIIKATDRTTGQTSNVPLMCQHCANPPCADVCPTTATFRRTDGIVLVDRHLCIGCRYCVMACPFGVRFFLGDAADNQRPHSPRGKGTAEGCNMCVHRVDHGRLPACVEACAATNEAMTFGDLHDPNSPVRAALAKKRAAQLRADLALAQGVAYQDL